MSKRSEAIKWAARTLAWTGCVRTAEGKDARLADQDAWARATGLASLGSEEARLWGEVMDDASSKTSRAWDLLRAAFLKEHAAQWSGRDYVRLAPEAPRWSSPEQALASILGGYGGLFCDMKCSEYGYEAEIKS